MIEPGWYVDYENPKQMRYHDGGVWTDYVHADRKNLPAAPVAPAVTTAQDPTASVDESNQDPAWARAIMYPLLGIFAGLMVGGLLFNAIGAITPVTETTGTVRNIEIEYSTTSSRNNSRSYVLSGTTIDGEDWQIVDEDAYNVLQSEGYPQPVNIAMGNWTDTPERVTGASFDVDHQSTAAKAGWAAMLVVTVLVAVGVTLLIARNKNGGTTQALVFFVCMLGPGAWIGFKAFQWIQSS